MILTTTSITKRRAITKIALVKAFIMKTMTITYGEGR